MPEPTTPKVPTRAHQAKSSARGFARIPTVMTADEIIESAFRRASKISVPNADAFMRMKSTEIARVRAVQNGISSTLEGYVKRFPSFDQLPLFYQDLAVVLVDLDRTRKALGAIDWAAKRVQAVGDEAAGEMKRAGYGELVLRSKSQAYGRISSFVKQVDEDLRHLDEARQKLKALPVIDAELPTIVVAGYPNVGKSSLVRKVSSGTPEVANYPFTTKGVVLGHFEKRHLRYQIVDTPGLLDRPLEERNPIELQALYALRHLADVIVFLVDPSEHCGYTLDAQLKLLDETKRAFPETPLVVAESKADLKTSGVGEVAISAETGAGIEDLMALLLSRLKA
jgi:nucleolar GTP-binding protein